MDLEDELKRLFADERLDVQVAADAEKTVVAGARRRRRRRVALISAAGVVAAAVVATGTIVLARSPEHTEAADNPTLPISSTPSSMVVSDGPSSSSGPPPTQPPPTAITESSKTSSKLPTSVTSKATMTPSAPQVASTVLNANGYGPFRFGMNQAQVEAAGEVTLTPSAGTCVGYAVSGSGVHLYVSKTSGLAQVQVSSGVRTPEGIGVGSTEDDVKAKYPSYRDGQVAVPGNTAATYLFTFSTDPKTVTDFRMVGSSGC